MCTYICICQRMCACLRRRTGVDLVTELVWEGLQGHVRMWQRQKVTALILIYVDHRQSNCLMLVCFWRSCHYVCMQVYVSVGVCVCMHVCRCVSNSKSPHVERVD